MCLARLKHASASSVVAVDGQGFGEHFERLAPGYQAGDAIGCSHGDRPRAAFIRRKNFDHRIVCAQSDGLAGFALPLCQPCYHLITRRTVAGVLGIRTGGD